MNLFIERFLELLLRQNNVDLTPDRIRHALAQVHTTIFEEQSTKTNRERCRPCFLKMLKKFFKYLEFQLIEILH